jgi:predicted nucleic acid-binding protein
VYRAPIVYEFWVVCTRRLESRGFGRTPAEAGQLVNAVERGFRLLRDTEEVYDEWRLLVTSAADSGKQAHDARLVAAMRVHRIENIVTFNAAHFQRYREIGVVDGRVW